MKTKAILAFVVAGALSFTACTKKVDEKTMAEINQFGTDWTTLGEKATAWSTELSEVSAKAKEFATKQTEMVNTVATSKDEAMKTKVAELATVATQNSSALETMSTEWSAFKTTYDETTAQYTEWKDKVMKGQVSPEEAVSGLEDFKTKMSDAQSKFDSWSTKYAEVKSSTESQMASAEEMTKTSTPEPKK